jgi:hypothetical protein
VAVRTGLIKARGWKAVMHGPVPSSRRRCAKGAAFFVASLAGERASASLDEAGIRSGFVYYQALMTFF